MDVALHKRVRELRWRAKKEWIEFMDPYALQNPNLVGEHQDRYRSWVERPARTAKRADFSMIGFRHHVENNGANGPGLLNQLSRGALFRQYNTDYVIRLLEANPLQPADIQRMRLENERFEAALVDDAADKKLAELEATKLKKKQEFVEVGIQTRPTLNAGEKLAKAAEFKQPDFVEVGIQTGPTYAPLRYQWSVDALARCESLSPKWSYRNPGRRAHGAWDHLGLE
jgi:hypothetical protein